MKNLIGMFLLCAAMYAGAAELGGVKIDDAVQLAGSPLVLNGAGIRSMAVFKMYAVGLYLTEKNHNAAAVFADTKPKRIALNVLAGEVASERFLNGFRKGIEKNHNEAQLATLRERMAAFEKMFAAMKSVKRGNVIALDWLPSAETRVSLNGVELGRIAGDDFYRALLSIWLGEKPIKENLKKALLG